MAKKKTKKVKFDLVMLISIACAVVMIVSFFLPFLGYKTESIIGDSSDSDSGLDIMSQGFPADMDDQQFAFGKFALALGSWGSIIGGAAIAVLLVLALLLGKQGRIFIPISKLVALVAALVAIMALIGAIIIIQKTNLALGGLLSYTVTLGFGLILYLIGAIGSLISAIMTK